MDLQRHFIGLGTSCNSVYARTHTQSQGRFVHMKDSDCPGRGPNLVLGLAHAEREWEKQRVIYFILTLIRQLREYVKLQFVSLASNKQLIHWSISHHRGWSD